MLGNPCPQGEDVVIEVIKRKILKQPMIIIPIPSPYCNEKWDYSQHGDDWKCDCYEGLNQSPLNLPPFDQVIKFENRTLFDFYSVSKDKDGNSLKLELEDYKLKIKGMFGSIVTWELIKYELYEVQFHTHSEHTIDGSNYDLEVQFYYKAVTPGFIRKSAAVALLFKVTPGVTNLFFDKTINILDLPDSLEKSKPLKNEIDLRHLFMSDEEDKFEGFSYYQYEGSFTSPPCQEETTWYVVSNPIPISYTTVEYLKDSLTLVSDKDCFKIEIISFQQEVTIENYRNIQNKNGRPIYYFDSGCSKKHKEEKKTGHYEKVKEEITRYYYINDKKPTGIPNAFVVSEKEAKGFLNKLD